MPNVKHMCNPVAYIHITCREQGDTAIVFHSQFQEKPAAQEDCFQLEASWYVLMLWSCFSENKKSVDFGAAVV